jgi:hypothetical protein
MISPFIPLSHAVFAAVSDVRARNFRAGRDAARAAVGGNGSGAPCENGTRLRLVSSGDEAPAVHGGTFHAGRAPTGLVEAGPIALGAGPDDLFAVLSRNSAAAVLAYRQLGRELSALGAPHGLRERVRRAASDSVRHTRMADALCARFGVEPERPTAHAGPHRTLVELATDNAVDGCVHGTWSAALALWQAEHTDAPFVRNTMRDLAHDRIRHAQLAWDIQRWAVARMDEADALAVAKASVRAVTRLSRAPVPFLTRAVRRTMGLPDPASARAIVQALFEGMPSDATIVRMAAGS